MPLESSNYQPSFLFRNGYVSTVYSGLWRPKIKLQQNRERITLSDSDFLDLDWSYSSKPSRKLIILLHGLEGNAQRLYVVGVAKQFNENGVDAVCINFRGCSGEENTKYHSYHSGASDDLNEVVHHALGLNKYNEIYINGFSLGGNIVLKYLGEEKFMIPKEIKGAMAVSVPCSLYGSCVELHKTKNYPYALMFLINLKSKLRRKLEKYPEKISKKDIKAINTLKEFDDVYTSKAHGFEDAMDYYTKCSSLQYLKNIKVKTLILNATNDSFLSPDCFPHEIARNNKYIYLETPKYGGHVGFVGKNNVFYNETRALKFLLDT
jgi:predicted alpha/beta-fold hydrolase